MLFRITCVLVFMFALADGRAAQLASHAELVKIFRSEKFQLVHRVREVSQRDWTAVGLRPHGRTFAESMVDPGRPWNDLDFGPDPHCQLFLAAKNPRYELLSYWEATHGGPMLRVLMLERRNGKLRRIFYGVMHNDIPTERWSWAELKAHILQGRFDPINA